eukprot:1194466-Prorocentrum_minimum.AAC.3
MAWAQFALKFTGNVLQGCAHVGQPMCTHGAVLTTSYTVPGWVTGWQDEEEEEEEEEGEALTKPQVMKLSKDAGVPFCDWCPLWVYSLSFCHWCPLRIYSLSPSAIGARYGYILSPLLRLVPATGGAAKQGLIGRVEP